MKDEDSVESDSDMPNYIPGWAAPEVMEGDVMSTKADIFSFAMVMIEVLRESSAVRRALANRCFLTTKVFTGAPPFPEDSITMATVAIVQGRRPPRPTHPGVTGALWRMMQRCWNGDPRLRPEASEVLRILLDSSVSHSFWRPSVP